MNMGLKCTLWAFEFEDILIKIGGKVKELQLFNMYPPFFLKGPYVIGQLTQKPFHGHMWAIPSLFHQLSK